MISTNRSRMTVLALLLTLFSMARSAYAADKVDPLHYFTPGEYEVTEGEEKLCGDGKFYVSDDKKILWLGPYYQMRLEPGVETEKGGLKNDEGCTYKLESEIGQKGRATIFTQTSTLLCGETKRQVITNVATVEKHKILLEQSSLVDPRHYAHAGGSPHHCAWVLKK